MGKLSLLMKEKASTNQSFRVMQIKKKENKNNIIELRKNVNYKSNKNKEKPYLKKVTQKRKYQENRKEDNNFK